MPFVTSNPENQKTSCLTLVKVEGEGAKRAYLRVFDHGQLEGVTGEGGIQVGLNGPAHALHYH